MVRVHEKNSRFMVEIRFRWPEDRSLHRERVRSPLASKTGSQRWGEERERNLLRAGKVALHPPAEMKEVPTLEKFAPRFIEGYARAEKHKASGIHTKERVLRLHLLPPLGAKPLDEISDEDVQKLKGAMAAKSRKTVNNVLATLSKTLHVAVAWKVIDRMPCTIKLLKTSAPAPDFYEFDTYAALVEATVKIDTRTLIVVLLGGDAGLRRGEMIGLRWSDVDFRRKQINVEQSVWNGIVDTPKSGKGRIVPTTNALDAALRSYRHLRGERVLYQDDGKPPLDHHIREWLESAQRRAGLSKTTGGTHILRHTFCSHLAMRGAPAKAIQELAGHASLATTLRYMHLSPSARTSAIALLNDRGKDGASDAAGFTNEPFSR